MRQAGLFKDTGAQSARAFDLTFSARPQAVGEDLLSSGLILAYAYPYLLAFLPDSIEVITLLNGNLVKVNQRLIAC